MYPMTLTVIIVHLKKVTQHTVDSKLILKLIFALMRQSYVSLTLKSRFFFFRTDVNEME